jgi:hypothetical protein
VKEDNKGSYWEERAASLFASSIENSPGAPSIFAQHWEDLVWLPIMRVCLSVGSLVALVLALVGYGASLCPRQQIQASSLDCTQSHLDTAVTLQDLDGDNLADHATLGIAGVQQSIELYLSRTGELVLPLRTTSGASGVLFTQDLDRDGDIDLLWRESQALTKSIAWLNDGIGHFTCLCPIEPWDQDRALGGTAVSMAHRQRLEDTVTPTRNPAPGQELSRSWDVPTEVHFTQGHVEQVWTPSCLQYLPSDRSPPLRRC